MVIRIRMRKQRPRAAAACVDVREGASSCRARLSINIRSELQTTSDRSRLAREMSIGIRTVVKWAGESMSEFESLHFQQKSKADAGGERGRASGSEKQ